MVFKRFPAFVIAALILLLCSGAAALSQSYPQFENILIQAPEPHTQLISAVRSLGGTVIYDYKHIGGIAVSVPRNAMELLRELTGSATILKDGLVPAPRGRKLGRNMRGSAASTIGNSKAIVVATPAAYALNNLGLNVAGLHSRGYTGAGVIVAVVDSGVRPSYPVLESDNSVIGGVDFVGDGRGFSNPMNDPHGTFVAGLISGNTLVNVHQTILESSLQRHFPGALVGSDLPLIGTAPSSSIYAVRVFGIDSSIGAPESRVLAAIDHIIDLKLKYQRGDPAGVNIQICNLSVGNTTLYAGRDMFDQSIDLLLANGIVPIVAAGDAGPSGMTVASPATAFGAIGVGSASPAANERVQEDVDNFLGYGVRFRPSAATQVGYFSARGPNADGRESPDVVAIGVGNFGQGYGSPSEVSLAAGVSFSAPLVAGVAALLRQAFPTAGAAQIRNAIIGSGNPSVVGPGFTRIDQGTGFPDAQAAYNNFANFSPDPPAPSHPSQLVAANIKRGTGLDLSHGAVAQATRELFPAQRSEILYRILPNTSQVVITVSDFKSDPNVSPENAFPEEIFLQVHSAKTSQIGALGDYYDLGNPFITGGIFRINNPEPGIMRITLSGAWTNQSVVSADVTVDSVREHLHDTTAHGSIGHHQQIVHRVIIPPDVLVADFRLGFRDDWANYPTSDLDMTVFDPNGVPNTDGAHLNAPEHATILRPTPGIWSIRILGFDIPAGSDNYELRVSLDGKVVR